MSTKVATLVSTEKGLLDRRIFVDQELYRQELEQIFGRCWLFVGHESQIAKLNDFTANYMGEDPVLVTRDSKGKLHTFLNMCRHRGNRICRADAGNAPSFMCTYHGWTFSTDGKLVGVPGYKEAYFEELDRSQWGLVEAAQIDTYKGLIFATWDREAPPLLDYLGDSTWYLDFLVDRRAGGAEVIGGSHKWVLDCNWKFGADNFGGDAYHIGITHGSVRLAGISLRSTGASVATPHQYQVSPGKGHGVNNGFYDGPKREGQETSPVLKEYAAQHLPELEQRLGPVRALIGSISPGNIFPNFTFTNRMVRLWHPRGPLETEPWSYLVADVLAPPEVKQERRRNLTNTFSPAGNFEQDDMNNFVQCTRSGRTWKGKQYPMNLQMGLGHEIVSEKAPGVLSHSPSETNQRSLYARWQEFMQASSWAQIHIEPRGEAKA